jgi:hypothetical protein
MPSSICAEYLVRVVVSARKIATDMQKARGQEGWELSGKERLVESGIPRLVVSEIRVEVRSEHFILGSSSSDMYSVADSPRPGGEERG